MRTANRMIGRATSWLRLATLAALSVPAVATTTTVADTIYGVDEVGANGKIYISISNACTGAGGEFVGETEKEVNVVSGAFTVDLVPNDTCTPANTIYNIRYVLDEGQWTERWSVPTSGSAVDRATVLTSSVSPVAATIGYASVTGCTAKGGMLVGSGTSLACQAVGTNNFVWTADSAQGNGVKWALSGVADAVLGKSNLANVNYFPVVDSAGTLKEANAVYQLGTANITQLILKAGSAQSTNPLMDFLDNSDTRMGIINASGGLTTYNSGNQSITISENAGLLASNVLLQWYNNVDLGAGSGDLLLGRGGAGIFNIADASGNDLGLDVSGLTGNRAVVAPDRAGDLALWRFHATDCTALTDGQEGEICVEQDSNTLYACEPSAGDCDTVGEWVSVGGGAGSGGYYEESCSTCTAMTFTDAELDAAGIADAEDAIVQCRNTVNGEIFLPSLLGDLDNPASDDLKFEFSSGNYHCKASTASGGAVAGDITAVGDCTTGACGNDIASGTPDGTLFLRDDMSWQAPTATPGADSVGVPELDDLSDTALVGEFVRVDSADATAYMYSTVAEVKTALSLNAVENTALSTWVGTTNLATFGVDGVQLAEIDDGADTPLVGEWLQVAAGATQIQYRTDAEARSDLGLVIGTNTQAWDAALDALAAGSNFVDFAGPTTAPKTFTLPDADATLLYSGGALGTPSGGTATNLTGLPLSTGVTGILPTANGGTGIAYFTAAGPSVARVYTFPDAAATILYSGGALGTPSGGTLTNATGLPWAGLTSIDAEIAALAGLTSAADKLPYFTGSGTAGVADFTAFSRTILDDADAATVIGTLGLGAIYQPLDAALTAFALGSDFVDFAGPTTAAKTFTLPDSDATLLYSGGALGTPSGGTLTNATGLPLTTGVTGVLPTANGGTGIAYFTAAGPTVARVYTFPDAAATILYSGGGLGTPSGGTLTNATGLPITGITSSTTTQLATLLSDEDYEPGDSAAMNAAVSAASTTVAGKSELATIAETSGGSETGRTVTPDGLAGSVYGEKTVVIELFDVTTDTATGDEKAWLVIPATLSGFNLVTVNAHVWDVGTTGTLNIDIARCAAVATGNQCTGTVSDVLSTNLTIDSNENKSATAAAAAVIDTGQDDVATDQVYRIDIDAVHTTPAKGLELALTFRKP